MSATQIPGRQVKDASINTSDLTDASVTTAKIANLAVDTAQINTHAVTGNKLFISSTKGDTLVVDNSANTIPLNVGADGTVPTADSSQSVGIAWKSPATRLLFSSITSSNSVANTTAQTDFDQSYTMPANGFQAGDVVVMRFAGRYIQASGTITLRVYIGTNNFLDLGAFTPTTSASERTFTVDVQLVVGSTGASGKVRGSAVMVFTGQSPVNQASTTDFTVDTTASNLLKMNAQWSAASASNVAVLRSVTMFQVR